MDDHKYRIKEKPWYKRHQDTIATEIAIVIAVAVILVIILNQ